MAMYSDYLQTYPETIGVSAIHQLRQIAGQRKVSTIDLPPWSGPKARLSVRESDGSVVLGDPEELSREQHQQLLAWLQALRPWKKGPFEIFGEKIDAEWRSDAKYARVAPHVGCLAGKRVADVGCHNGYFMFRMLAHQPELVVGFDPARYLNKHFGFWQALLDAYPWCYEPFGYEALTHYPKFFQVIFCMGVIYHLTDPMACIRAVHHSLATGGFAIIESQGILGADPVALTPEARYAGASGIWCLPTVSCLHNWLKRANFREIIFLGMHKLDGSEQRATPWAPIPSLPGRLDPKDPERTIEGYPAPYRLLFKVRK